MRRQNFIFELIILLLIFIFLLIPPVLTSPSAAINQFETWAFPLRNICISIFCLTLYFIYKKVFGQKKKIFYPSLLALGCLIFFSLILKFIASHFNTGVIQIVNMPGGAKELFYCFLTFITGAIYEEIIYRFYFADAIRHIAGPRQNKRLEKVLFFVCEVFACIAFALAHRYLGIFAVINAALAHIVLRFLYVKTGLIWNCVLIHFVYNIISLILL